MLFKTVLLLASSLTASVMGAALQGHNECGTPEPTDEQKQIAQQMFLNETMLRSAGVAPGPDVYVPVYVHIVAVNKTANEGWASEGDVRTTIAEMNHHYKGMGFQFTLKEIDYTINKDWAMSKGEIKMKTALRKGDYKTLNIYFIPYMVSNGYSYYPEKVTPGSEKFYRDGCVVRTDVMRNKQTTTHEVGHWLGLFHTFESGCEGAGDMVDDTPALKIGWDCDENLDTCPDLPGNDPVHNFLSYGDCRNVFTPGQGARMRSQYALFRK